MSTRINVTQELLGDLKDFRSSERLQYWDIVDVYCDKERVAMIADAFIGTLIEYLAVNPTRDWVQGLAKSALEEAQFEEGEGREHLKMEIAQVLDLIEPHEMAA